jgi:hypothetical protein
MNQTKKNRQDKKENKETKQINRIKHLLSSFHFKNKKIDSADINGT